MKKFKKIICAILIAAMVPVFGGGFKRKKAGTGLSVVRG